MNRNRERLDVLDYIVRLERRIKNLESSNRSGNTSVDSGSFTLTGGRLAVTDTMGNVVFELEREGDIPVIYMHPTFGNPNNERIKISSSSTVDNGPEFRVEIQESDGTPFGGYLSVSRGGVALSQFSEGGVESGISFSPRTERERAIVLKGLFWPNESVDANQATYVGRIDVDAGFSALTVSYDRQMPEAMVPIPSVLSATPVAWGLSSQTDLDFTVSWADTTAKTINYWCFAVPAEV